MLNLRSTLRVAIPSIAIVVLAAALSFGHSGHASAAQATTTPTCAPTATDGVDASTIQVIGLAVSWDAQANACAYRVILSSSPSAERVDTLENTTDATYTLPSASMVTGKKYKLTIRILDAEGRPAGLETHYWFHFHPDLPQCSISSDSSVAAVPTPTPNPTLASSSCNLLPAQKDVAVVVSGDPDASAAITPVLSYATSKIRRAAQSLKCTSSGTCSSDAEGITAIDGSIMSQTPRKPAAGWAGYHNFNNMSVSNPAKSAIDCSTANRDGDLDGTDDDDEADDKLPEVPYTGPESIVVGFVTGDFAGRIYQNELLVAAYYRDQQLTGQTNKLRCVLKRTHIQNDQHTGIYVQIGHIGSGWWAVRAWYDEWVEIARFHTSWEEAPAASHGHEIWADNLHFHQVPAPLNQISKVSLTIDGQRLPWYELALPADFRGRSSTLTPSPLAVSDNRGFNYTAMTTCVNKPGTNFCYAADRSLGRITNEPEICPTGTSMVRTVAQNGQPRQECVVMPPGPPTNLRTTRGTLEVTLEWDAPAAVNNRNFQYAVLQRKNFHHLDDWGDATYVQLDPLTKKGITRYVVQGLEDGYSYRYKIQTTHEILGGLTTRSKSYSNIIQVDFPIPPPDPPANLTATPGKNAITLMWDEPTNNAGLKYEIERQDNTDTLNWTVGPGAWFFSGLIPGVTYTHRVRSVKEVSFAGPPVVTTTVPSDWSNSVETTLLDVDVDLSVIEHRGNNTPKPFADVRWQIPDFVTVKPEFPTGENASDYDFRVIAPYGTGIQVIKRSATLMTPGACDWSVGSSNWKGDSGWVDADSMLVEVQLHRCRLGDGTSTLTVQTRAKSDTLNIDYDSYSLEVEQAWHVPSNSLSYFYEGPQQSSSVPQTDVDNYIAATDRGAGKWNTALGSTRSFTLSKASAVLSANVVVKGYAAGSNPDPCGAAIAVACVPYTTSTYPHVTLRQTLFFEYPPTSKDMHNNDWVFRWDNDFTVAEGNFKTLYMPIYMAHEFGHAAGLWHSPDASDGMTARIAEDARNFNDNDKNAMKALYGDHTVHIVSP